MIKALLLASALALPAHAHTAGDIVMIDGFRYEIGEAQATDCHLEDAEGYDCLYVLPGANGNYPFEAMRPHKAGDNCSAAVDDYPKLEKLLSITTNPDDSSAGWYPSGASIDIWPGDYCMGQEIQLKQYTALNGQYSARASAATTVFNFYNGTPCLTVNRYNTLDGGTQGTPTTGADGSQIKGIFFEYSNVNYCMWLRARAVIEDLGFDGPADYDVKVVATAGSGGATEGNANLWYANRIKGRFRVDGADVNVPIAIGIDAKSGSDCGIKDTGFLGAGAYIGAHTSGNAKPYCFDNDSARQLMLGGYAEGNQGKSTFDGPMLVVGGIYNGFDVGGSIDGLDGNGLRKLSLMEVIDGGQNVRIGGGNVLMFWNDAENAAWPWRFKFDNGNYAMRHANMVSRDAFRLTSQTSSEANLYRFWMPYGAQIESTYITEADFQ